MSLASARISSRWICLLLGAITLAVYWQVSQCEFISYDDPEYVTENAHVKTGLKLTNVAWALRSTEASNWHPVTWVSHLLDGQLFGLRPAGHHLVNVAFHALNAILVFLVFQSLTGAKWRSAGVAALFVLHPLQVGSVAWVAERKNVLSTLFWLLAIWVYAMYVTRVREAPRPTLHAARYYTLTLLLLALGLMSKPMLVTAPFLFLLLDYWPLCRLRRLTVVWEKIPFLALAVASTFITWRVQAGAMAPVDQMPINERLANALVAYARYIGKFFWPSRLIIYYPRVESWPWWAIAGAVLLLVAITVLAVIWRNERPYLLTGWFWFVGTLVPVIGLVQVGTQAMADRYMYVPMIGLSWIVVWGAAELVQSLTRSYSPNCLNPDWRRVAPAAVAGVALGLLAWLTARQIPHWRNTETVFRHALAVTSRNATAHYSLGSYYLKQMRLNEAREQYESVLRIRSSEPLAHGFLGLILTQQGKVEEGLGHFHEALRLAPDNLETLNNLAWLLATHREARFRNGPEAVRFAERAVGLTNHADAGALDTLAAAYAETQQFEAAASTAARALELAQSAGQPELVRQIRARLELYRAGQSFRE